MTSRFPRPIPLKSNRSDLRVSNGLDGKSKTYTKSKQPLDTKDGSEDGTVG